MTPDPREDALAKAIERVLIGGNHLANWSGNWPGWQLDGLDRRQQCESSLRTLGAGKDYDMWCCWSTIMQERDTLAALSALPSQSESDDEKPVGAIDLDKLRELEKAATPGPWETYGDGGATWVKAAGVDVSFGASKENSKNDAALITALRNAAPAILTPSPTPYVRPAAEIRAEIKQAKFPMSGDSSDFAEGYRAGLTFALTPPTQEKEQWIGSDKSSGPLGID